VVVDIANIESVELAPSWKQEVVNNATVTQTTHDVDEEGQPRVTVAHVPAEQGSIPILLLGNKLDVVSLVLINRGKAICWL
jgi:protein lin-28